MGFLTDQARFVMVSKEGILDLRELRGNNNNNPRPRRPPPEARESSLVHVMLLAYFSIINFHSKSKRSLSFYYILLMPSFYYIAISFNIFCIIFVFKLNNYRTKKTFDIIQLDTNSKILMTCWSSQ